MYRYLLKRAPHMPFMKTPFTYLVFLLLFIGCNETHQLTLSQKKFAGESCKGCPQVSIKVPQVEESSKLGKKINDKISEEITTILLFGETEDLKTYSIEKAMKSFDDAHKEIVKIYEDESDAWEATIEGEVTYEDKNTLTIIISSYLFTGGAHGYQSNRFLNFDKRTGKELKNWQLFSDKKAFETLAEKTFRKVEGIPLDGSINSTGFMFEQDSFYLPENIGFTKNGIKLLYNQYEVASYADGPVEITLPYKVTEKFLKNKIASEVLISTTTFEDSE